MTAFLPRIVALGVQYVWLSPIFLSPWKNYGYDVSDYYTVDGRLGTIKDFDEFVRIAHGMGLKIILDLPVDSTSVEHNWFIAKPGRYIWNNSKNLTKQNLRGDGSAWQEDEHGNLYLALNHPHQANLNWFDSGVLNRDIMGSFKRIMYFWLYEHDIDGFRLESMQPLNDISTTETKLSEILIGKRAVTAINELSNLYGGRAPFLIMECIDPSCGEACDFYGRETDVEFITNKVLKDTAVDASSLDSLKKKIARQSQNHKFMLDLESHDSPRFTSRTGLDPLEILTCMFESEAQAICLYQGQELGLGNSCADAQIPIPLDEYDRQESDPDSVLKNAKALIEKWKKHSG